MKIEEFLNCQFCSQPTTWIVSWNDGFWKCEDCLVNYLPNPKVVDLFTDIQEMEIDYKFCNIREIHMYANIDGKQYLLRQFMNEGYSRIDLIPDCANDTTIIILELNFLLPSVTPFNIKEKLHTYIMFS